MQVPKKEERSRGHKPFEFIFIAIKKKRVRAVSWCRVDSSYYPNYTETVMDGKRWRFMIKVEGNF